MKMRRLDPHLYYPKMRPRRSRGVWMPPTVYEQMAAERWREEQQRVWAAEAAARCQRCRGAGTVLDKSRPLDPVDDPWGAGFGSMPCPSCGGA